MTSYRHILARFRATATGEACKMWERAEADQITRDRRMAQPAPEGIPGCPAEARAWVAKRKNRAFLDRQRLSSGRVYKSRKPYKTGLTDKELSLLLRDAWERSGMRQADFARELGIGLRTLRVYFDCEQSPRRETWRKIRRALKKFERGYSEAHKKGVAA